MISAFSNSHNRKLALILLAACGVLAFAAAIVGINDNLPGILLAFLAASAFVLTFVHPWQTAKKFLFLILASVLGFVLFVILNIILDTVTQNPTTTDALKNLLQSPVIEALSIIVVMLCAAAFIVGVFGSITMFIRNRHRVA